MEVFFLHPTSLDIQYACNELDQKGYEVIKISEITNGMYDHHHDTRKDYSYMSENKAYGWGWGYGYGYGYSLTHGVIITAKQK